MVRAAELCPTAEDPDKVIKDMKKWLKSEGLTDMESVSLFAEQLERVSPNSFSPGCYVSSRMWS